MERYETVGVEVEFAAPLLDPDTMIESDDWYLRARSTRSRSTARPASS